MARPKQSLELTAEQLAEFRRLIKAPGTPQKIVRRARIAIMAAEGKDNRQIAVELNTSHVTVGQWRQRVIDMGLAGIQEAPRPGRPSSISPQQAHTVLSEVVRPPHGRARWSCLSLPWVEKAPIHARHRV